MIVYDARAYVVPQAPFRGARNCLFQQVCMIRCNWMFLQSVLSYFSFQDHGKTLETRCPVCCYLLCYPFPLLPLLNGLEAFPIRLLYQGETGMAVSVWYAHSLRQIVSFFHSRVILSQSNIKKFGALWLLCLRSFYRPFYSINAMNKTEWLTGYSNIINMAETDSVLRANPSHQSYFAGSPDKSMLVSHKSWLTDLIILLWL